MMSKKNNLFRVDNNSKNSTFDLKNDKFETGNKNQFTNKSDNKHNC